MQTKNVRNKSKVDETERVKLYKTHRGWCSSLSRFWTFLKAASVDEDDETSYEDYLKAIATIGTIAGATMLMPTTAMADSTQLQKTMDSRRSMAIGLSSNSQSESTSGSTDNSKSLDSTDSTTQSETFNSTDSSSSANSNEASTSSTSSEDSQSSIADSKQSSENSQTASTASTTASEDTVSSSTTTSNSSSAHDSQSNTTPDYGQQTDSQATNTLTAASVDPQAAAANYLQDILSQLWAKQSNQVIHSNTILDDEYLNNENSYTFDWSHIYNDSLSELFDGMLDGIFNHDWGSFCNFIQNYHGNGTLDLASIFGTFSNHLKINADYRGNLATGDYQGGSSFGTQDRINGNLTTGDVDYIQKISGQIGSNAFSDPDYNRIVFGNDVNAEIGRDGNLYINGNRMDHVHIGYNADVFKDKADSNYIDFEQIFNILNGNAQSLSQQGTTPGVRQGYYNNPEYGAQPNNSDYMIDVSKAQPDANNRIYVNVPYEYLTGSRTTTIRGLTESNYGPVVVINVTGIPEGQTIDISRQLQLHYDNWRSLFNNGDVWRSEPNHLLWNFGTTSDTIRFDSTFAGSVLAPNAHIITSSDFAGNIAADTIENNGTFRRWDLNGQLVSTPEMRSLSTSMSTSIKASTSESIYNSASDGISVSNSEVKSQSEAASASTSEITSTSNSASTSTSKVESTSSSTSASTSRDESISASESESTSELESTSTSESESASESESTS
ncbi:serine-rich glycoprotein adhesin, partial [uncultured Limosilactobacillus sp.]|uniref:serine-rich glycoprotein adhesin n=1 Tax=uncultured Limosilactobacillus sp. TaxID=2837629 RepID=UPI0025DCFBC5